MLICEARSWLKSGRGPDEGGERELGVEFRERNETVLASDGAKGLVALGVWAGDGGARPFPLPRILPPPSLRPDIMCNCYYCGVRVAGVAEKARVGPGQRRLSAAMGNVNPHAPCALYSTQTFGLSLSAPPSIAEASWASSATQYHRARS
jgi:hypothetical protein